MTGNKARYGSFLALWLLLTPLYSCSRAEQQRDP
jgi:hypothetical protein